MSLTRKLGNIVHRAHNLKQAVSILFVTVLISNVLGLLRNVIIANRVGISYGTIGPLDNYYAAFVLPDLLYNILIVGALSSAILPLLTKIDADEGEQKFWFTYNTLLSSGITVIVLGLALLYLILPYLVRLFFPGFTPDNLAITLQMTRVMLLSPLFFTISQISTSALQAKKRFFAPAIAPIIYNLAIIVTAFMIPRIGISVLVVGVVVGAIAHFLVQLPSLLALGWRFEFRPRIRDPHVRNVLLLMIPRTIALTSTQLLLAAFDRIASTYSRGAIAIYSLTDSLQTAPVLLLANTLAVAILPDFARHFAKSEHHEFNRLVSKAIRLLVFIFVPATIFFIIFRQPMIHIYLALGHSISQQEIARAESTLYYFSLSLFFQGSVLILARAYFARHDTFRPTLYSIISLAVAWTSALIIRKTTNLEVAGLALAFSIGSAVNAVLLWSTIGLSWREIWRDGRGKSNFLPIIFGGIVAALTGWLVRQIGLYYYPSWSVSPAIKYVGIILAGLILILIVYWLIAVLFDLEQWHLFKLNKRSTEK